jgi:hypothetical protein
LLFRTWTLINIRPHPCVETFHIGRGLRQSLNGFDWWRRDDKIGQARCHGSGNQNGWNNKSPADHFPFAFSSISMGRLEFSPSNILRQDLSARY